MPTMYFPWWSLLCQMKVAYESRLRRRCLDDLQDFLIMMEDEKISDATEPLAYDTDDETSAKASEPKINPAGVLKWVTRQSYKPLRIGNFKISVKFNHYCLIKNPLHKLCFPVVRACAREILLPVSHMKEFDEFNPNKAGCFEGSFSWGVRGGSI